MTASMPTPSPMPASDIAPRALYLNPTLLNPTTHTIAQARRREIVAVARRSWCRDRRGRPLWLLAGRRPARRSRRLRRSITWHVAGLAKCLGAGLAYRLCRSARCPFRLALCGLGAHRNSHGITAHRCARDALDHRRYRRRFAWRQCAENPWRAKRLAAAILPRAAYRADPVGFHLWLSLPEPWTRSAFVGHTRSTGVSVVASDAFATDGNAARGGARLPWRPRRPRRGAHCARVHGARLAQSPTLTSTFL